MTALGRVTILWPFEGGLSSDTYLFKNQLNQRALGLQLKHVLYLKILRKYFGVFGWGPSFALSPYLSRNIARHIKRNYPKDTLILINHPWLGKTLKHLGDHRTIYLVHNIESKIVRDSNLKPFKKKLLSAYVAKLERKTAELADKIVFLSETDFNLSTWDLEHKEIQIIGVGSLTPKVKDISRARYVVFVGGDYLFNIEAAQEVIHLAEQMPDVEFKIIGSVCNHLANNLPNVSLLGWVPERELSDILARGSIFINPMKHGSGIHLKLIKAMSFQLPIITTPIGWRGFEKMGELQAQIAGIEEFAQLIENTLSNYSTHMEVAKRNSLFIAKELNWKNICGRFNNFVFDVKLEDNWEYVDPYSISWESIKFENEKPLMWRKILNKIRKLSNSNRLKYLFKCI